MGFEGVGGPEGGEVGGGERPGGRGAGAGHWITAPHRRPEVLRFGRPWRAAGEGRGGRGGAGGPLHPSAGLSARARLPRGLPPSRSARVCPSVAAPGPDPRHSDTWSLFVGHWLHVGARDASRACTAATSPTSSSLLPRSSRPARPWAPCLLHAGLSAPAFLPRTARREQPGPSGARREERARLPLPSPGGPTAPPPGRPGTWVVAPGEEAVAPSVSCGAGA